MDAPPQSEAPTRRGVVLKLGLSVAVGAVFVVALRPYLRAIPEDLSVPVGVIVLYLATLVPYHLLRAGRWRLLLQPLGGQQLPGLGEVTRIGLAGYMWIALMPFRLGEFARPVFLAQRSNIKVSTSLGTVAIERAVDGVLVCALFFAGMAGASPRGETEALFFASYAVMAAFAGALAGMLAAARWPDPIARLARFVLQWAPGLADWAETTVRGVAEGFRALPDLRAISAFVGASLGYWLANAAGMWVLAHGCGLALSPFEAIATLAIMNLALLVPGGPAQLGVFHAGVAIGLHLFVSDDAVQTAGSTFAFYLYVCQLSTIVLLGLVSQWSLDLDWRAALRLR
jgi:uncharacterized membrane protein YbhN (UPF0104 family)